MNQYKPLPMSRGTGRFQIYQQIAKSVAVPRKKPSRFTEAGFDTVMAIGFVIIFGGYLIFHIARGLPRVLSQVGLL